MRTLVLKLQMVQRLALVIFLFFGLLAGAAQGQTIQEIQAEAALETPLVVINPALIKTQLLDANIDVLLALNKVQKAKQQVNVSRGNLLPSINLGFLLSGDPSFLLSSVNVLLPFLLPSNWFILKENKQMLAAEGQAYYIAQLNAYASGLALYQTYLGDRQIRNTISEQLLNFRLIEEETKRRYEAGKADLSEVLQAQAQSKNALLQVSQMNVLLGKEASSIREMLSLPLEAELNFEDYRPEAMPEESLTLVQLAQKSFEISPEKQQMRHLVEAARLDKWVKAFSFITGGSLNSVSHGDSSASFSNMTTTGSVGLGFGYFPSLQISNLNIAAMQLREKEIELENSRLAEDTILVLNEGKKQVAYAAEAEIKMQQVYEAEKIKFENGWTDLLRLFQIKGSAISAKVARIKAQLQLDQVRYNLQRTLIVGQFAGVKNCDLKQMSNVTRGSWWDRLLKRSKNKPTVEQACHS